MQQRFQGSNRNREIAVMQHAACINPIVCPITVFSNNKVRCICLFEFNVNKALWFMNVLLATLLAALQSSAKTSRLFSFTCLITCWMGTFLFDLQITHGMFACTHQEHQLLIYLTTSCLF